MFIERVALRPDALTDGKMAPGTRHDNAIFGVATLMDVTGVDGSETVERKDGTDVDIPWLSAVQAGRPLPEERKPLAVVWS